MAAVGASDVAAAEHVTDGAQEELEIQPQRPVRDIEVVDPDHLLHRHARAEHLPGARHARREVQPAAIQSEDLSVLLANERTWADEAHLAPQHVEELRQLVERRLAEKPADPGHAWIAGELEHPGRALAHLAEREQVVLAFLRADGHRAELDDPEVAAVAADADLAKQDGAARLEPDGHRDREQDRADRDRADSGGNDVESALERKRGARESERADAQEGEAVDIIKLDRRADDLEQP